MKDEFLAMMVQTGRVDPSMVRRPHMAAYDALAAAHLAMRPELITLLQDKKFFENLKRYEQRIDQQIKNPRLSAKDNINAILNFERGQAMFGEGGGDEGLKLFSMSMSQAAAAKGALNLIDPNSIGPFAVFANKSRTQAAFWTHLALTRRGQQGALAQAKQLGVPILPAVAGEAEYAKQLEELRQHRLYSTPMRVAFADYQDTLEDTLVISQKFYQNFMEALGPMQTISIDLNKDLVHKDLLDKVEQFLAAKEEGKNKNT